MLTGAAEVVARLALRPVGARWEYWDPKAAEKFEGYRAMVRDGDTPDVLIVGDSTAARNLDPRAMSAALPSGVTSYNLGWPANFPLAMRWSTLPLLDQEGSAPRIVLVSLVPTSFVGSKRVRAFEASILNTPFSRHMRGEWIPADTFYLARLRRSVAWKSDWFASAGPRTLPSNLGFMPLRSNTVKRARRPEQSQDTGGDVEVERIDVLVQLQRIAQRRGFRLVVIVPPHLRPSPAKLRIEEQYITALRDRLQLPEQGLLDLREVELLQPNHFIDGGHLNAEGAGIFSKYVGRLLGKRLP